MKNAQYALLAIALTGTFLWALRSGRKIGKETEKNRSAEIKAQALETRNEAVEDTLAHTSDDNRDFLRQFEGPKE